MNKFEEFERMSRNAKKEIKKMSIEIPLLEGIIEHLGKEILEMPKDYSRLDELNKAYNDLKVKKERIEKIKEELSKYVILVN